MSKPLLDRRALLERLERIEPPSTETADDELETLGMGSSLLALAGLNHEREYERCRALAAHLLRTVPEPPEWDIGEEED
jgi:hypothetical protein